MPVVFLSFMLVMELKVAWYAMEYCAGEDGCDDEAAPTDAADETASALAGREAGSGATPLEPTPAVLVVCNKPAEGGFGFKVDGLSFTARTRFGDTASDSICALEIAGQLR
jgi:hypothetical protein